MRILIALVAIISPLQAQILRPIMTSPAPSSAGPTWSPVGCIAVNASCSLSTVSGDRVLIACMNCSTQTPTFSSTSPSLVWTTEYSAQMGVGGNYIVVGDSVQTMTGTMTCSSTGLGAFADLACVDLGAAGTIDGVPGTFSSAFSPCGTSGSPCQVSATGLTQTYDILTLATNNFSTTAVGYTVLVHDDVSCGCSIQYLTPTSTGTNTATLNSMGSTHGVGMVLIPYQ